MGYCIIFRHSLKSSLCFSPYFAIFALFYITISFLSRWFSCYLQTLHIHMLELSHPIWWSRGGTQSLAAEVIHASLSLVRMLVLTSSCIQQPLPLKWILPRKAVGAAQFQWCHLTLIKRSAGRLSTFFLQIPRIIDFQAGAKGSQTLEFLWASINIKEKNVTEFIFFQGTLVKTRRFY